MTATSVLSHWAWIAALSVCVVTLLWRWLIRQRKKCFRAFEGTGIPVPPLQSLVNGHADAILKQTQFESFDRWLKEYGDVFGFFLGDVPFVVVNEPNVLHEIFAREFNKFTARGNLLHIHQLHPLFAGNMVFTKGELWKSTRTAMAQFFTPAKLKSVLPCMIDEEEQFLEILGSVADAGAEVDIGHRCERLTFDVISKAAFGIDTHVQKSTDNPLYQTAVECLPNIMKGFFYNLGQNLYNWSWFLRAVIKIIDLFFENPLAIMTNKAKDVIEFRRRNPHVDLPDMAQILLNKALKDRDTAEGTGEGEEGNRGPLPTKTLNELATNVMNVFLAGYDTTRLALTYWFFVMGKNPEIQEKMRDEVLEAFEKEGKHLSVQTLMGLPCTNQVINEVLRMYPPVCGFTTRKAKEDFQCGNYLIKEGMSVIVPTYNLHHDPHYWTDPEKFDPERFSPKNKHLIYPVAYQPFGLGVRVCVGQRFALIELASTTAQVLRHFRITLGPSQKSDLGLRSHAFLLVPKNPVRIKLHRLQDVK
ncbi:putative cytochrome P450 6a13 [Haemaphysalis longicornis]